MQIKRDIYLKQLIDSQWNRLVKVITGLRRSGKTYLLFNLYKQHLIQSGVKSENIIEIKLDLPENASLLTVGSLWKYIEKATSQKDEKYYVFIDEIQNIKKFESIVNGLISLENVDAYITGSNSKFLSTDIKTEIRGRGWFIHVYPLTFKEFVQAYDKQDIKTKAWDDYMLVGGLPQLFDFNNNDEKMKYLKDIALITYVKDIVEKNKIKNEKLINDLIHILASNCGSLTNPLRLSNTYNSTNKAQTNSNQISNYLSCLKNAFLINESYRYDIRGNSYFDTPLKYYFEDVGIRNALVGLNPTDKSHVVENIIFNELLSRGFKVDIGVIEKVIKNKEGKSVRTTSEIDFVASKTTWLANKYYIQYSSQMEYKTFERELTPLFAIKESFNKIIITNNLPTTRTNDGIWYINLFDFLLNPDLVK